MILFQSPYLTIEYDQELRCLIQCWKRFATSTQFREGINKPVTCFQEKTINKLVSDIKDFAVVKKDDTDWVASYATPVMIKMDLNTWLLFFLPMFLLKYLQITSKIKRMELYR